MFLFKIVKRFFIVIFFAIFSFLVLINIPVAQKKIFSEFSDFIGKKNIVIQYDDIYLKFFHIFCVNNLKIFYKKNNEKIFEVDKLKIDINPFSFLFYRTFSCSDVYIKNVKINVSYFTKEKNNNSWLDYNFLSVFNIEINNSQIKNCSIVGNDGFLLHNVSGYVKKVFFSCKNFYGDLCNFSFLYDNISFNSFSTKASYYFSTNVLELKCLRFNSNYGVFDGVINIVGVDKILQKKFNTSEIFVSVNKFLFPINKINNVKVRQIFSNDKEFITLKCELELKNRCICFKNCLFQYLNSFFVFNSNVENVFDYKKLKYSICCNNFFVDFKNFVFHIENKIKQKIETCSFVKKTFSVSGDIFKCNIDGDFNTGCGNILSKIKIQNYPFNGVLFNLRKILVDGILSDNVFVFWDGLKNIKSHFLFDIDFLSKNFSCNFNIEKCQYKKNFFNNIRVSCANNAGMFNMDLVIDDPVYSLKIKINPFLIFKEDTIKISGVIDCKQLPFCLHSVVGNDFKKIRTNIDFKITRNNNFLLLDGIFSNLSFYYKDKIFTDEQIILKYSLKNKLFDLEFKSVFVDVDIKNIPQYFEHTFVNAICNKNISVLQQQMVLQKNIFNIPLNIKIKHPLFLMLPFAENISLDFCSLDGVLENNNTVFRATLCVECPKKFFIKNNEIGCLKINFLATKERDNVTKFFIKSDKLILNKKLFSIDLTGLCGERNNCHLICVDDKKTIIDADFIIRHETPNWIFLFNSSQIGGEVSICRTFCFFKNFFLRDKKNDVFFSISGGVDFVSKNFDNIKMFCKDINISFLSFWLDKSLGGVCFCDIQQDFLKIKINDFLYDEIFYGDIETDITRKEDYFYVNGNMFCKKNICSISGKYFMDKTMDLKISFNDFNLYKVNPLMRDVVFFNDGVCIGDFLLKGNFNSPRFLGSGKISGLSCGVKHIGTYCVNCEANVVCSGDNKIKFDKIEAYDKNKSLLSGNGFFEFNDLTHFQVGFSCNLNNFELLNFGKENHHHIYGGGCLSGKMKFFFSEKTLKIDCDLKTNKMDVSFFNKKNIYQNDFIFIFDSIDFFLKQRLNGMFDIILTGDLDITDEACFTLWLNEYIQTTVRGAGKIKFFSDCNSVYDIRGVYNINGGSVVLKLHDLFSKTFFVKTGGSIILNGPFNSLKLNISADTEINNFNRGGVYDNVIVLINIYGNFPNFVIYYSITSKIKGDVLVFQQIQMQHNENELGKLLLLLFFNKQNSQSNENVSLSFDNVNSFVENFLPNQFCYGNLSVGFNFVDTLTNKTIRKNVNYNIDYKVVDDIFLHKSDFLGNGVFNNFTIKYVVSPKFFCFITFKPYDSKENKEDKNLLAVGVSLEKDFEL